MHIFLIIYIVGYIICFIPNQIIAYKITSFGGSYEISDFIVGMILNLVWFIEIPIILLYFITASILEKFDIWR